MAGDIVQVEGIEFKEALGQVLRCVEVCAARVGRAWPVGVLAGLFGHAFESSYAVGCAELWSGCAFEWYHHARGYRRLGLSCEAVEQIANNPRLCKAPTVAERREALDRAWEIVERSLARGVPALIWSPMSPAQRDAGMQAFCWGLVEGCDPSTREFLVCHPNAGRFRTPCDELGRVDQVQWLHVMTFAGVDPAFSPARAASQAIADGVAILRGETAGADMPAPRKALRHGPAAFLQWAQDVECGRLKGDGRRAHARWWSRAREAAVEFCGWARGVLTAVEGPLTEAQDVLSRQATALRALAEGEVSAEGIREVVRLQEEAIAPLARAS